MARQDVDRWLTVKLAAITVGMFAFGFALVPLYDVFCEITGLDGRVDTTAKSAVVAPDLERTVRIEFVTDLGQYAPWEFEAPVRHMDVHPGQLYNVSFSAKNLAVRSLVGSAIPKVTPGLASPYLQKTECFCFEPQEFSAGELKQMPVAFVIDPELPDHIDTLTLSYTFYAAPSVASAGEI